jgi:nicotinate phosphoribosyltransferase
VSGNHFSNALLTDLYQLTMLRAYFEEGMEKEAAFSLFARRLPRWRNFLLPCGLDNALRYLETLSFDRPALDYLASLGQFPDRFLRYLETFRFSGDVYAVPEGTPIFANEPLVEVVAPIPQAQLVESALMNHVHLETALASKAVRVVIAAAGRTVVDFGMRRMHGVDAALRGARAFYIAGVQSTSNVAAGQLYGIPVSGTMAHSYIQAHDDEYESFRAFAGVFPETILLVDTYDTLEGIRKVVALAEALGSDFKVRGVRLDSGDLAGLAFASRRILDEAGLPSVRIFASGSLDEYKIAAMVEAGAPIDAFGVGTKMGVAEDAPSLDVAYKLVEYAGKGRTKLSTDKLILPSRKQVFRSQEGGRATGDVIARHDEKLAGRPLLRQVMSKGERTPEGGESIQTARARAKEELARLPENIRGLAAAEPPYPVRISEALERTLENVRSRVAHG